MDPTDEQRDPMAPPWEEERRRDPMAPPLEEARRRCTAEITALHRTIEGWLTGSLPRDAATFSDFADAHADGFAMITPDGALVTGDALLPGFERAHGSAAGLRIEIDAVAVRHADDATVLATYVENQHGPAGRTARLSTVLFVRDADARHGLRSRHLHETWIDGA